MSIQANKEATYDQWEELGTVADTLVGRHDGWSLQGTYNTHSVMHNRNNALLNKLTWLASRAEERGPEELQYSQQDRVHCGRGSPSSPLRS